MPTVLIWAISLVLVILCGGLVVVTLRCLYWVEANNTQAARTLELQRASLERFTEKILSDVGVASIHAIERQKLNSQPALQAPLETLQSNPEDELPAYSYGIGVPPGA